MAEVITVQDLETLKKHEIFEAEVITGKVGGLAGGADIPSAINPVTGQTQDTLPQILSDLGMQVQPWSSSIGGVLTTPAQIFLNDTSGSLGIGDYYAWGGPFPKTVPAGTDPALPGSGYILRSNKFLKSMVLESLRRSYAESGYTVVGTFQAGFTIVAATDVGIDESTGQGYTGPLGVVAPGTDPLSGGFTDQSGKLLRDSLALEIKLSKRGFVGDGSASDDAIVTSAFSEAASTGRRLVFDVAGVYSQINFQSNVTAHVTKDMTLKSNPSVVPQAVSDSLFVFNGTTGFSLTFKRDVILRGGNHAVYQEFSHCIRLQGGCSNGYIGPHKSQDFDGDGLYINGASDIEVDRPFASRPGRNGISIVGDAINVTINKPFTSGLNVKPGSIHGAAIDIEPNNACDLELHIIDPSGYGDSTRVGGLVMYLERNSQGTPLGKHQIVNIVNPVYTKFLKNYVFQRTDWVLATGDSVIGSVTVQNPKSYDHINNAYYVESWQAAGGLSLAVDNPAVIIRHSVAPQAVTDAGYAVCFTRNQSVYDDPSDEPVVDFSGLSIIDRGFSGHAAYILSRYAETVVRADISTFLTKQPNIPVVEFSETGKGSLGTAQVTFRAPRYLVKIVSTTLSYSDCLYIISNRGATADVTHVLPILPLNQLVTFENVVSSRNVSIQPPEGMRINLAAIDAPYVLTSHKSLTLKRINASDFVII